MISAGLTDEGLTIIRALRSRYNGRVRNPWNEYECGSYYARAMASYALLINLAGFHYSAVTGTLRLSPRLDLAEFQTFFSAASGWGTLRLSAAGLEIDLAEGSLQVDHLELEWQGKSFRLEPRILASAGKPVLIDLK